MCKWDMNATNWLGYTEVKRPRGRPRCRLEKRASRECNVKNKQISRKSFPSSVGKDSENYLSNASDIQSDSLEFRVVCMLIATLLLLASWSCGDQSPPPSSPRPTAHNSALRTGRKLILNLWIKTSTLLFFPKPSVPYLSPPLAPFRDELYSRGRMKGENVRVRSS